MNSFIDGRIFRALVKMGDFIILAALTVLCCVPVVTVGASLTAAFYAGRKLVLDEESYVYKDFFKSFKQNTIQGIGLEFIFVIIGLILFADFKAAESWGNNGGGTVAIGFIYLVIGIALIYVAVILYSFALLSRYNNTIMGTIKNALIICVHHLPQTIVMLFITVALLYFTYLYFIVMILTIPIILYADSYIFARIFKALEEPPKEESDEGEEEDSQLDDEN
ncbi:YesL family protein [Lachnospira sp.]|jgi:uncharacterized membrane protein YesL|uniref:YesL family protein n=1 Tax=Lachnospira sp. TaxID=2049031 RepID=UPI002579583C|nr:YesL family protein [Lachnospira sp.]